MAAHMRLLSIRVWGCGGGCFSFRFPFDVSNNISRIIFRVSASQTIWRDGGRFNARRNSARKEGKKSEAAMVLNLYYVDISLFFALSSLNNILIPICHYFFVFASRFLRVELFSLYYFMSILGMRM